MKLYLAAKQLVEDAERRQLRAASFRNSLIKWILTEFWYPLGYVVHGLDFLIQNLAKTVFYVMLFITLTFVVSSKLGLPSEQTTAYLIVATILAVFVILFALPSTFSHLNLGEGDLRFLAERIQTLVSSKEELLGLEKNLELMEESVMDRVKALHWSLATLWALFLFAFNQSLGVLLKLDQGGHLGEVIGGSISTLVIAIFAVLFPLLGIVGYRRASNLVFRALGYACNEVALHFAIDGADTRRCNVHLLNNKGQQFGRLRKR